jgi:hypothetical protein
MAAGGHDGTRDTKGRAVRRSPCLVSREFQDYRSEAARLTAVSRGGSTIRLEPYKSRLIIGNIWRISCFIIK